MTTKDLAATIHEFKEIQAYIKQLEAEAEALKAAMIAEMESKGIDNLQVDVYTVRYTEYESKRLDTTAIKAELPDLAERFTKITKTRRFSVA